MSGSMIKGRRVLQSQTFRGEFVFRVFEKCQSCGTQLDVWVRDLALPVVCPDCRDAAERNACGWDPSNSRD